MTPTQTEELIEEIKYAIRFSKYPSSIPTFIKAAEIALAALLDTENDFVMCPREPTEKMVNKTIDSFNKIGCGCPECDNKFYANMTGAAIAARPQSALDKILNTTKEN